MVKVGPQIFCGLLVILVVRSVLLSKLVYPLSNLSQRTSRPVFEIIP